MKKKTTRRQKRRQDVGIIISKAQLRELEAIGKEITDAVESTHRILDKMDGIFYRMDLSEVTPETLH